jgi:uncharacterized membrane protein YeaQ/YmgE (transglycosylase-associated protein family)
LLISYEALYIQERTQAMINVLVWLLFGVLLGSMASRLTHPLTPLTIVLNSIAGIMGALMGGIVFLIFDTTPLNTVSLGGVVCAIVGAMLVIVLVSIMFRRPI